MYYVLQMNAFDNDCYNCLHIATSFGHANILEILAAHKHGRTNNLYWDEDYLDRLTNTSPQLTALQIACQRKDKECKDILLKYGAKPRERTQDELQCIEILQKYGEIKVPPKDEFSFPSELDVINWNQFFKTENPLSNVMQERDIFNCLIKYNHMKCCKINENENNNKRRFLNLCIAKKCLKCIRKVSSHNTHSLLRVLSHSNPLHVHKFLLAGSVNNTDSPRHAHKLLLAGSVNRSDNMFNVIRYLCETNVNISDYLLSRDLHGCILGNLPRESLSLLIRAYGMNEISSSHFSLWVNCYWQLKDYETLGLLHMAVQKFAVCYYVSELEYARFDNSAVNPLLLDCIKQSTCVYTDLSSRTNLECLEYAAKQPRTLQNWCIISVRQSISENVIYNAQQLPLPNVLKKKIVLTNDIK